MDILGIALLALFVLAFLLLLSLKTIRGGLKFGLLLFGIGILLWLGNMGLLPYINWGRDWPWVLIILGLWIIIAPLTRSNSSSKKIHKKSSQSYF